MIVDLGVGPADQLANGRAEGTRQRLVGEHETPGPLLGEDVAGVEVDDRAEERALPLHLACPLVDEECELPFASPQAANALAVQAEISPTTPSMETAENQVV